MMSQSTTGGKGESKLFENAESLVQERETLHLGIVNDSGYPVIYPMEKVGAIGLKKVFFITKKDSKKVKYLLSHNKCTVECHDPQECIVSLFGTAEIVTDLEKIKLCIPQAYWLRLMKHKDAESYCLLEFNTEMGQLYQSGQWYEIPL